MHFHKLFNVWKKKIKLHVLSKNMHINSPHVFNPETRQFPVTAY